MSTNLKYFEVHTICICSSRGARERGDCLPYPPVSSPNFLAPAVLYSWTQRLIFIRIPCANSLEQIRIDFSLLVSNFFLGKSFVLLYNQLLYYFYSYFYYCLFRNKWSFRYIFSNSLNLGKFSCCWSCCC